MIKLQTDKGCITINSNVFNLITGAAATNCFGVKGMAVRSVSDGLVRLLKRDVMSKGVHVVYNEDGSVSIDLHIIVDHGVNISVLCSSIISEVRYTVNRITGVEVKDVNVFVESVMAD